MRQEKTWKKSSMTSAEDLIITFHGCNAGMPERNKLRMKEMIYDFAIHTLYYENQDIRVPNFSLAIDTLELVFEIQTGKLLCIQGFFPLVQASEGNVNLPECKKGDYLLHNFDLILAYHTQGQEIYWNFQNINPPNGYEIGEKFAKASGYLLTEVPYNSSFAGYKDWFILYFDKPGYTIEAGFGENPLPISQFDEIYNDNLGILILGAVS